MLFFRSEAEVVQWCAARGTSPGPIVPMDQLWKLSTIWYGSRLTLEWRRPRPETVKSIFAGIGLTDPFWDPLAGVAS